MDEEVSWTESVFLASQNRSKKHMAGAETDLAPRDYVP